MILIAIALLVSLGLWVFVRLAPHWGLVDQPNSRSLHTKPTVVSGGITPILVLAAALPITMNFAGAQAVALITFALTAIGLLDDLRSLPSGLRFLCYLGAGLVLCWLLLPSGSVSILVLGMGGLAVAWCINLVNFMDGADGLVSTQTLCVALGMGLIATFGAFPNAQLAWLSAILFACWAPLLWFNWPTAKLFMGDAGAIRIGTDGTDGVSDQSRSWVRMADFDDALSGRYGTHALYQSLCGRAAARCPPRPRLSALELTNGQSTAHYARTTRYAVHLAISAGRDGRQ
jgi:Fuc2NAc and GlcNAc transferase